MQPHAIKHGGQQQLLDEGRERTGKCTVLAGLGAAADVAGLRTGNSNSTGVALDMVTATFGPRYTWSPANSKLSFYGQGLVCVVNGSNSVFPNPAGADTSATGIAAQADGA